MNQHTRPDKKYYERQMEEELDGVDSYENNEKAKKKKEI